MTMLTQPWQPLSRSDRHVRQASLRLPEGVSEHRATFLVEEALRLMALPGEDQGRTYYFRRVALRGLAMAAPPREWVERAQSTMHALAVRALHGADTRAADADAVFFNSQEEALEWLLRRLFRGSPRGLNAAEWFAPMISPAASGADRTARVVAVVERLRSLPAGWFAAATVILDALTHDSSASSVLQSIPEFVVRMWLSELGGETVRRGHAPRLSDGRKQFLRERLAAYEQAASFFRAEAAAAGAGPSGLRSVGRHLPSHLVWLAALAVLAEDPGEIARGSAVASAMGMLEELGASRGHLHEEKRWKKTLISSRKSEPNLLHGLGYDGLEMPEEDAARHGLQEHGDLKLDADASLAPSVFTGAAGLYFLLNVLRHLGIETSIEALPSPLRKVFLPKLIRSLALSASVSKDDPAMLWVAAVLDAAGQEEDFDGTIAAPECWPRTLLAAPDTELTPDRLVRVWTVAVRRWCWLNARLTLREIVSRPGRILLARTDLDVTLSMDTVDLRLRRVGLDLDPGWLPWFGRVVRFHYVHTPSRSGPNGGESA